MHIHKFVQTYYRTPYTIQYQHDDTHHHHLFCSDCGEIIDIQMGDEFEKTLSKEIKRIEKKFNFSVEDHRLELFGKCTDLCENCS